MVGVHIIEYTTTHMYISPLRISLFFVHSAFQVNAPSSVARTPIVHSEGHRLDYISVLSTDDEAISSKALCTNNNEIRGRDLSVCSLI